MGYKVIPFNKLEQNLDNSFIVMRHDVDFSPAAAVKMAALERGIGVSTTYFLQLHSYFYSLFGDKDFLVHKILELGHELGYHYDIKFMKFFPTVKKGLEAEIHIMEEFTNTKISSFSQHDPSVDGYSEVEIPGCIDAYALTRRHSIKYLSDSVQRWREGCFCQHLGKYGQMQVTVHPEIWTEDGTSANEIYLELRSSTIKAVEAKYAWLKNLHKYYLANKPIPERFRDYSPKPDSPHR
jgi:hypothetical protein